MADLLVIDFETYYDRGFSLSKLTTEEYIRGELFEVIGVAVKRNEEPAVWFSGPKAQTKRWLEQWDWDSSVAVAHNAMFDMAILNWHFDIRPKRIADTLSMLRAIDGPDAGNSLAKAAERYGLGAKGDEVFNVLNKGRLDFSPEELDRYGQYCINDVELTYQLFRRIAAGFPVTELRLIDLTVRMFSEPVLLLEKDVLQLHLSEVQAKKKALLDKALISKDNLMSNEQLAETLRSLSVEIPMKTSPVTGKETYAFAKSDEEFKALLEHENVIVQAIVAARLGVKSTLEETRTARFLGIAGRGTLPIPLRYYAAHTGRFGGDDKVNMQNLPRESMLKRAILAPEGYLLVDCDSSQIEARTLAWMAGQNDLVEAFAKGDDVYKIMASAIYGIAPEEVDKDQRFVGKTAVLGCGYGMGAQKFQAQLLTMGVDLPLKECRRIIAVYRETYEAVPALWDQASTALEAIIANQHSPLGRDGVLTVKGSEGIYLPNGLRLAYPGLRWEHNEGKPELLYNQRKGKAVIPNRIYGGKCVENFTQALARIIVGEQMLMVARRYKVVMTVHDSVVAMVPEREAREGREFVETCMRMRPKWATDLPLNCESKIGASYGG